MTSSPDRYARTSPSRLAAARSTVTALMRRHHVPGLSVAVTDSSGLLHSEAFGHRALGPDRPATPDTAYLWFSMSKVVTATAALRLADEGRLDLEAPVSTLVPGFRRSGGGPQPVVWQLLDHTSGAANPLPLRWVLPTERMAEEGAAATAALLARLGRPRRSPGGAARYSNVGYLVLAEAVAAAAGRPFEEYVREAVLDPAGMTATGYGLPDGALSATGYVRAPRPLTPLLRAMLPNGLLGKRTGGALALESFRVVGAGYGGLVGPVTDAARLLRLHLGDGSIDGHRVLRPETALLMRDVRTPGRRFDLGLGWFRPAADRDAAPAFVEHWGTGAGFWNAMRFYPELDLGIVLMANTTRPYEHAVAMDALRTAFRG